MGIEQGFATLFADMPTYSPSKEAARTVTLGFIHQPARTFRAGDYAENFRNVSFREDRWAYNYLAGMAERHERVLKQCQYWRREMVAEGRPQDGPPLGAAFDEWAERHIADSLAQIRSAGGMASAMVTGPSNFPVHRQNKIRDRFENKTDKLEEMTQAALKRLKKVAYPYGAPGEAVRSGDPEAIAKLKTRLEGMEAEQARMKELNAAWRKAGKPGRGDDDGWIRFNELAGLDERTGHTIRAQCENHYMAARRACPPCESYQLTNNNANMKRIRERLADLEAMKDQEPTEAAIETIEGEVELVENTDIARIQLIFPGKPEPETRAILKRNGFRWAPSQSAWQRHLNPAGQRAAAIVLDAIKTEEK